MRSHPPWDRDSPTPWTPTISLTPTPRITSQICTHQRKFITSQRCPNILTCEWKSYKRQAGRRKEDGFFSYLQHPTLFQMEQTQMIRTVCIRNSLSSGSNKRHQPLLGLNQSRGPFSPHGFGDEDMPVIQGLCQDGSVNAQSHQQRGAKPTTLPGSHQVAACHLGNTHWVTEGGGSRENASLFFFCTQCTKDISRFHSILYLSF